MIGCLTLTAALCAELPLLPHPATISVVAARTKQATASRINLAGMSALSTAQPSDLSFETAGIESWLAPDPAVVQLNRKLRRFSVRWGKEENRVTFAMQKVKDAINYSAIGYGQDEVATRSTFVASRHREPLGRSGN